MMKLISPKRLYNSFKYAFSGLKAVFQEEQSFRIQLILAVVVVVAMFVSHLHYFAKAILFLTIFSVLGMEILNTQIERTLSFLHPGKHPEVRKIKDLAASAVLMVVIGALLVGFVIFLTPAF